MHDNAAKAHTDITGLEAITGVLNKDAAAVNESLAVGPIALANLVHAYQESTGTLGTRSNLSTIADPAQICGALKQLNLLSGTLLGSLTSQIVSTCNSVASPLPGGAAVDTRPERRPARRPSRVPREFMMKPTVRVAALLAAATVALSGCGFHGLYAANLPGGVDLGSHPMTLTVEFADVLDLVPQSAVKVNDVPVGKVKSVSLDGWIAKVEHRGPRRRQAAGERPRRRQDDLAARREVRRTRAAADDSRRRACTAGSTIPIARTGTAPEVEEVLGAMSLLLNGGGLDQIRTITTELNKALRATSRAVRDLLGQLNTFVGGLDRQKDEITTALVNVDKLAATLNQQKQTIINTLDTMPAGAEDPQGQPHPVRRPC